MIESDIENKRLLSLYEFALEYLKTHTYISSKKLELAYLGQQHTMSRNINGFRFRHTISQLVTNNKIFGYNNAMLYKRV